MISLKEYAKSKQVSYEAVRKQVTRYSSELGDHVTIQNRTKLLDDYAVTFLDKKRQQNPVIVQDRDWEKDLEKAQTEIEKLRVLLLDAQKNLMTAQGRIIDLQDERTTLLEKKSKHEAMLRSQEQLRAAAQERAEKAEKEIQKYRKTIFGLYKLDK